MFTPSRIDVIFWVVLITVLSSQSHHGTVTRSQQVPMKPPNGCGPRALATLLAHIGKPVDEGELARLSGMDEHGFTSMYGLAQAAKAKGLETVGYQLRLEEFADISFPLIAHINGNHFVVVSAYTPPHLTIIDNHHESDMMISDFARIWDGTVLVVQGKQNGHSFSR